MSIRRLSTNAFADNGILSNNILDGSVVFEDLSTSANILPVINRIVYTDSNFNEQDDLAADNNFGYIKIIGSGFTPTTQIYVSGYVVPSQYIQFVNSKELNVLLVNLPIGDLNLYTVNSDGAVAIKIDALKINPKPIFETTNPDLGYVFIDSPTNLEIKATGNPAYTLQGGSLPNELTLSTDIGTGTGRITGTITSLETVQDFNISVNATNQFRQNATYDYFFTYLPNDTFYRDTVLHISADDVLPNVTNNANIFNESNYARITAALGTPSNTTGSFSPYLQSGWSANLNGTNHYVRIFQTDGFILGGSDFTIESFIRANSILGNSVIYSSSTSGGSGHFGILFEQNAGNTSLKAGLFDGHVISVSGNLNNMSNVYANQWKHIALERYNGILSLYVDGVSVGNSVNATGVEFSSTGNNYIGASARSLSGVPSGFFQGLISNFRIQKNEAVYTKNFSTPKFALRSNTNTALLLFNNPFFRDESSYNANILFVSNASSQAHADIVGFGPLYNSRPHNKNYGGSMELVNNYALNSTLSGVNSYIGSNVFTIEGWFYSRNTNDNASYGIMSLRNAGKAQLRYIPFANGNSFISVEDVSSGIRRAIISNVTSYCWHHYAIVDNQSNAIVYVDGIQRANILSFGSTLSAAEFYIGTTDPTVNYWNGYFSDIRLVRGTQVYTGNFTPPYKSLGLSGNSSIYYSTANVNTTFPEQNTLMYYSFTNAQKYGVIDNTGRTNLSQENIFANVTSDSKFGSGAIRTTAGYYYVRVPTNYYIGIHDFTIEAWINTDSTYPGFSGFIIDFRTSGFAAPLLYMSSGVLRWWYNSDLLTTAALSAGTWYHVAVCRFRGFTRLFVNGVTASSFIDNNVYPVASIDRPVIGTDGNSPGTSRWIGRIDDLRFTKSARYRNSTFDPPTRAFVKL